MRRTTEDQVSWIRWTLLSTLEDLDCADDIALLSHTHRHIQEKTNRLNCFGQQAGLAINCDKSRVMYVGNRMAEIVRAEEHKLEFVDTFNYLESTICCDGGASSDIRNRLSKARSTFARLKQVCKSSHYSTKTKHKIYRCSVLSTLLHGSECWRMVKQDLDKLSSFHTTSLRRILRIFWWMRISCNRLNNNPEAAALQGDWARITEIWNIYH